jgi:hypothetical protein
VAWLTEYAEQKRLINRESAQISCRNPENREIDGQMQQTTEHEHRRWLAEKIGGAVQALLLA